MSKKGGEEIIKRLAADTNQESGNMSGKFFEVEVENRKGKTVKSLMFWEDFMRHHTKRRQ